MLITCVAVKLSHVTINIRMSLDRHFVAVL